MARKQSSSNESLAFLKELYLERDNAATRARITYADLIEQATRDAQRNFDMELLRLERIGVAQAHVARAMGVTAVTANRWYRNARATVNPGTGTTPERYKRDKAFSWRDRASGRFTITFERHTKHGPVNIAAGSSVDLRLTAATAAQVDRGLWPAEVEKLRAEQKDGASVPEAAFKKGLSPSGYAGDTALYRRLMDWLEAEGYDEAEAAQLRQQRALEITPEQMRARTHRYNPVTATYEPKPGYEHIPLGPDGAPDYTGTPVGPDGYPQAAPAEHAPETTTPATPAPAGEEPAGDEGDDEEWDFDEGDEGDEDEGDSEKGAGK